MRAAIVILGVLYAVLALWVNLAAEAYTDANAVYNLGAFVILLASFALIVHVRTAFVLYLVGVPVLLIGLVRYGSDVLLVVIAHGLLTFAVMRLLSRESQRREEWQRQRRRDMQIDELLQQQAQQRSAQFPCPSCQRLTPANVRFCGNCGTALVANA